MPPDDDVLLVLSKFPDEPAAADAIRQLLRENRIACGTIQPGARSIYVWNGKAEDAAEVLVWLSTTRAQSASVVVRLGELHPFDVPEIVTLNPESVHGPYADWVRGVCKTDANLPS